MLIRAMNPSDHTAFCLLLTQVHGMHAQARPDIFREQPNLPDESSFAQMLSDENSVFLAAEENGEMVGMCLMEIRCPKSPILHPQPYGWIGDLCVREDCRSRGIGHALHEAAMARAKELNLCRVELMVWAFNERARHFYESLGMRERSRILEQTL